jgi:WD40 repeat protein
VVGLQGHTDTVEDVVFKPASKAELASVGDDKSLRLWDTRVGDSPITTMENAHGPDHDLHCVDWSSFDPNLIATGEGYCWRLLISVMVITPFPDLLGQIMTCAVWTGGALTLV